MRIVNSLYTYSRILLLSSLVAAPIVGAATLLNWFAPHALLTPPSSPSSNRLASFPPVMLWAWERPEAINFIDPSVVGIAFLAKTIHLRGTEVIIRPK
jgi:hypothetical protein